MNELTWLFNQLLHTSDLAQLAVILLVVIFIAGIMKALKQPLIIGYLLAGIIVWPLFLGLVSGTEWGHSFLELFSHLWIALLLFMVGVELNIHVIKQQWKVALGVGCIQIVMCMILAYLMSWGLGYDMRTSIFIALGLTFSSTIVIVKLLWDKEEDQMVYGKISIWILIVQDLVVMMVMMGIALRWWDPESWRVMFIEWLMLLWWVVLFAKYILPFLVKRLVKSEEFLLLIGIGWCLILWTLFQLVGFSFEIWCLLAWMSFATSPFRVQLVSKLKPLRDFFLVLFFIALGLQLSRDGISDHLGLLLLSVFFVLICKPMIIYLASVRFGYTHQVSFKSWVSLGQISEFGFLILSIGLALWYIQDESLMSVMVLVGLITIWVSSYMTMHNNELYTFIQKYLGKEKVGSIEEALSQELSRVEVMIFGFGRIWWTLANKFHDSNISHVVIDHNPELVDMLEERNGEYIFADATNIEIYRHMFHSELKMVISTIRDLEDDLFIIKQILSYNDDIIIVTVSNHAHHAVQLYEAWADYVIMPDAIWAKHTTQLIDEMWFDVEEFIKQRLLHLEELQQSDN